MPSRFFIMGKRDVCIVHYNTPEITSCVVRSVRKWSPSCDVTIFDNSDRTPYISGDVKVIDNTHGEVIDFKAFLDSYPDKLNTTSNDWGSAKHTRTVQELWAYFPDGFILLDSDAIVKSDISDIADASVAACGEIYSNKKMIHRLVPRLLPFLCWINVPTCVRAGISYFDGARSWKLNGSRNPADWYDTGASFLEDCLKAGLAVRNIDISGYIEHLRAGSYSSFERALTWLDKNRIYYE